MASILSPTAEIFAPRNGSGKSIQDVIDEISQLKLKSEKDDSKTTDDAKSKESFKLSAASKAFSPVPVKVTITAKKPTNPTGYANLSAELREMILKVYFSDLHMVPKKNRARINLNNVPNVIMAIERYGDPDLLVEALRVLAIFKTFYFSTLQGPIVRISEELIHPPDYMEQIYKSTITFTDNPSLILKSIPAIHTMTSLQDLTLSISTPLSLSLSITNVLPALRSLLKLKVRICIIGSQRCGYPTKLAFFDAFKPHIRELNRLVRMNGHVTVGVIDDKGKVRKEQVWVWDEKFREGGAAMGLFVVETKMGV